MANETVDNEIQELFEKMIVSKITASIENLKESLDEIIDISSELEEKFDTIPTRSFTKHETKEIKDDLQASVTETVKQAKEGIECKLTDIDQYVKSQNQFSNGKRLGEYLEESRKEISHKIDEVASLSNSGHRSIEKLKDALNLFESNVDASMQQIEELTGENLKYIKTQLQTDSGETLGQIIPSSLQIIRTCQEQELAEIAQICVRVDDIKENVIKDQEIGDLILETLRKLQLLDAILNNTRQICEEDRDLSDSIDELSRENEEGFKKVVSDNARLCTMEKAENIENMLSEQRQKIADEEIANNSHWEEIVKMNRANEQSLLLKDKQIKVLIAGEIISIFGIIALFVMQFL